MNQDTIKAEISVEAEIERQMRKKKSDAKRAAILKKYQEKLVQDAIKEEKERKTSAVCFFIFLILNIVVGYFLPANITAYPIYIASAFLMFLSLFKKTSFELGGIYVLFAGGFYGYLLYNANLNILAMSAFAFWASAVLFTVRLKRFLTVSTLLAIEAIFIFLIYLLLK